MSAERIFYTRFPPREFKQADIRPLFVHGIPRGISAKSSHTSPIPQTSPMYNIPAYNIKMLEGIKIDDRIVCITLLVVPFLQIENCDVAEDYIYFGALVGTRNDEVVRLIEYARIPLVHRTATYLHTEKYVDVPVILRSDGPTLKSPNTNNFVFFCRCKDGTIQMSIGIAVTSWTHERRRRLKREPDTTPPSTTRFSPSCPSSRTTSRF